MDAPAIQGRQNGMGGKGEPGDGGSYAASPLPFGAFYFRGNSVPVRGQNNEHPLIVFLGGASGVGKTELAILYTLERHLGFNIQSAASHAGVPLDLSTLGKAFGIDPQQVRGHIYTRALPKFTTREPRPGECGGISFYYVSEGQFKELADKGKIEVRYRYPNEKGAWYGVPSAVQWPLGSGRDSVLTMTGYDSFSRMSEAFPNAVGVFLDAPAEAIEQRIKGRPASQMEKGARLEALVNDQRQFDQHREDIPYSIFVPPFDLATGSPSNGEALLKGLDGPYRQLNAIVRWERHLRGIEKAPATIQEKYDLFLDTLVGRIFHGKSSEEVQDMLTNGRTASLFDLRKDSGLLDRYCRRNQGMSRSLLDNIIEKFSAYGLVDGNGRRTLVVSPYNQGYLPAIRGTERDLVIDLINMKVNGLGASFCPQSDGYASNVSIISGLHFPHKVEEGILYFLSSDHLRMWEHKYPRALNIIFSEKADPAGIQQRAAPVKAEDLKKIRGSMPPHAPWAPQFAHAIRDPVH